MRVNSKSMANEFPYLDLGARSLLIAARRAEFRDDPVHELLPTISQRVSADSGDVFREVLTHHPIQIARVGTGAHFVNRRARVEALGLPQ